MGPQYVVKAIDAEMGKNVHTVLVPIADYELVVTRDPANVQAMLATSSTDWDVGKARNASWRPLLGDGVFTSRGEAWKRSRALVRPQFTRDQINDLGLIERHVQQLFSTIDCLQAAGPEKSWTKQFDLQPLLFNLTLDITTELIYGYSAHSQNKSERIQLPTIPGYDNPDRENIGTHIDAGKAWIETRGALWKYRWLLPTKQFNTHCAAVHKYADWFIRLRLQIGDGFLADIQHETSQCSRSRYILLDELAKVTQDPVELRSQTLNILVAGRDATASLLGWIFYFLARHPGVFSKLRGQILERFGPYISSQPSGIEFQELRNSIPYINSVINEALRMAPVIPLNERVAVRDTVLPRGGGVHGNDPIFVPAGKQVLIPTYAMARREDIWGHDVDVFRPERWEECGGRKFGFEFIPFGGGIRQCLGQSPPDAPMRFHHTIENRSGSGTLRGHKLLMITPWEQPAEFIDQLAVEFPDLKVAAYRQQEWEQQTAPFPEEEWQDVTILLTFTVLPTPKQAPRLEYVQLMSAGANHVLELPMFKDTTVPFCTANGVHGPQIAEWIIGTYLAFQHRFPQYHDKQKEARWDRSDLMLIDDAVQKTIGILGYGSIGRQTARLATAMGMKVHAYTLHPRETPTSKRDLSWTPPGLGDPEGVFPSKWFSGHSTSDLHTFLSSDLDILVIATPLTPNTQYLLSAAEFEVLAANGKRGKTFVSNIARGPVVNTLDLITALEEGLIKGAALDVTDPEPLPFSHQLWSTKNVIITPHVSGASTRYNERVLAILKYNMERLSKGEELVNKVNKEDGY
ncbi:oxidoreductase-like protein [Podospora australis]|uniref:Oxidoreductase-like protein n=1 Tax=Podospora australis TaxID=1536484 RepID=A0AAN6WQU7_9PEZI|nr:oxidoreductase-like protein [Podospora australis]